MKKRRYRILCVLLCAVVALVFVCGVSVWRSYNVLTVNSVELQCGVSFRAVFIADLHSHSFGEGNAELLSEIQSAEPEYIFMGGDMLNGESEGHGELISFVSAACEIAPVYYALGNHELDYMELHGDAILSDIEAAGATVLENDYVDLDCGVRLGGMYGYAFALNGYNTVEPERMDGEVYDFLTDFCDTESYKLLICHRPDSFVLGQAPYVWDVDTVLSGHVHGGQIVVPFRGGLWAPDQGFFPEYDHGYYEVGRIGMYITGGLGAGPQFIPRMNNLPEIVVMEFGQGTGG